MDQEKIEELKKLAKPIQDFMASNAELHSVKIEGNKIIAKYSGEIEIKTHYHNLAINTRGRPIF